MKIKPVHLILRYPAAELPNGASHFWGSPDLPADMDFPTYTGPDGDEYPYVFICQVNLAELASFAPQNPLPRTGLLSFFARIDRYLGDIDAPACIGGSISEAAQVKVFHFPSLDGLRECVLVDDEDNPLELRPLSVVFSFKDDPSGNEHTLFASPDHRPWEKWDYPFEDHIILLQVDSYEGDDFELNFMDCGVLDFLISPSDLARHDFNEVRAIVLSS